LELRVCEADAELATDGQGAVRAMAPRQAGSAQPEQSFPFITPEKPAHFAAPVRVAQATELSGAQQ
jgi:hypothetical protein